ncbi:MAG: transposase [Fibrobacteria bacterium]|nr:transposase [Fibrobacteria bacterium]
MRTLAKTVEGHLEGIVRVFNLGVTNVAAESLNARIQAVRVKCRGYRHFQAFRGSVLFHLGGLYLYPRNPHSAVLVSG